MEKDIDEEEYDYEYVDIYVGSILMMRVDRNWWNAPYKAGETDANN